MTTSEVPELGHTYHPGTILQLYRWPPPAMPEDLVWCDYKDGAPPMTQIADRYTRSIEERISVPSTPPDLSIILENRLVSSMGRIPHVWSARVQGSAPTTRPGEAQYPPLLVVKLYDPTFYDDDEAEYADPFALRDLTVSREVAAYQCLEPLQGTGLPKFYGHFITPIATQQNRTIGAILLEYVEGTDLRLLVPGEEANAVCSLHKDAVVEAALRLFFEIYALGVHQTDMQPRNVILRSQKGESGKAYCSTPECPLRLKADCKDLRMVMVDFEMANFIDPDPSLSQAAAMRKSIDGLKGAYLTQWLENGMV